MTLRQMKFLDRFGGVPLCWCAAALIWLTRNARKTSSLPRPLKRVLVIKFFGIGSIVLSTSAVCQLKNALPNAEVTFLTFADNKPVLLRAFGFVRIITMRRDSFIGFSRDLFLILRLLVAHRFDAVIDFEFFSKFSTFLSAVSRAPIRGAFSLPTRWRKGIVTHSVEIDKSQHVIHNFGRLVSVVAGDSGSITLPHLTVTPNDRRSLVHLAMRNGIPIAAINVNAGEKCHERRWSPRSFSTLVRSLGRELPHDFYFTGVSRERAYVQSVIDQSGISHRCRNVAGLLDFGGLCALLERCEFLVSNDSGPVHVAVALGVRVVALYGPESPTFYGALDDQSTNVYARTPCSPCMNIYNAKQFRCPFNARCMKDIRVLDVRAALTDVMAVA